MEEHGSSGRISNSNAGIEKNHKGNSGKGRGRPRKLPFSVISPTATKKLGLSLNVGHNVLFRWSDGLFYAGQVLMVDEASARCQVRFEATTFWVLFKDIHKEPGRGETSCCVCKGETSEAPNDIVVCDSCELGFHQQCHNPPVVNCLARSQQGKFFCQLCTYAAYVTVKETPPCAVYMPAKDDVKQKLPYKLNLLTWDPQHRTNKEQRYCYCGGPGDWYCKMLQCCRCRQWFHEACLQCLKHLVLYGDRFFLFVCSHCNQGQEFLKRLQFRWVDVLQLALFNLTLLYVSKYYDLDVKIIPWLSRNLPGLGIHNLLEGAEVKSQEIRSKIEEVMEGHKSKFYSGRGTKKKSSLWALKQRIPPNAPSISVPLSGPINDEVLKNPKIKGRKMKQLLSVLCLESIPLKYRFNCALLEERSFTFKKASCHKIVQEVNNNVLRNISPKVAGRNCVDVTGSNGSSLNNVQTASCDSGQKEKLPTSKEKGRRMPTPKERSTTHAARSFASNVETITSTANTLVTGVMMKTHKRNLNMVVRNVKATISPDDQNSATGDFENISPEDIFEKTVAVQVKNIFLKKNAISDVKQYASSPQLCSSRTISPKTSKSRTCRLDCLVPVLPNFEGVNHPFKTELEKGVERAKMRHFQSRIAFLPKEYAAELAAFNLAQSVKQHNHNGSTNTLPFPKPLSKSSENRTNTPDDKQKNCGKRKLKHPERDLSEDEDSVRRSKRSRVCVNPYQHLWTRVMSTSNTSASPATLAQRSKWASLADQLRYGEKFQIEAHRITEDGRGEFLLHWSEEHLGSFY